MSQKKTRKERKKSKKFKDKYFIDKRHIGDVYLCTEIKNGRVTGKLLGSENHYSFSPNQISLATNEEIAKAVQKRIQGERLTIYEQMNNVFKEVYADMLTNMIPSGVSLIEQIKDTAWNTTSTHIVPVDIDKP